MIELHLHYMSLHCEGFADASPTPAAAPAADPSGCSESEATASEGRSRTRPTRILNGAQLRIKRCMSARELPLRQSPIPGRGSSVAIRAGPKPTGHADSEAIVRKQKTGL